MTTSAQKQPLFTAEAFQAMGSEAFTKGQPRPEGTNWQCRAKQLGYDQAKSNAESPAVNASNPVHDAFFDSVVGSAGIVDAPNSTALISNVQSLIDQKKALDEQIERETTAALETVKTIISEYGFSAGQIFGIQTKATRPHANKGSKVAPKYRNPANGATWTGRGKEPLWIKNQDRTKFAIQ